jgi:hypothetical protein
MNSPLHATVCCEPRPRRRTCNAVRVIAVSVATARQATSMGNGVVLMSMRNHQRLSSTSATVPAAFAAVDRGPA